MTDPFPAKRKRNDAEYRLTCLVADLLRFAAKPGLYWTHMPMGEARSERTGARLKRMGTRAGAPDFLLIWKGRPIGLELKAEGGRQSQAQRDTEQAWMLAGGLYILARGYQAAVDALDAAGVIRTVHGTKYQPMEAA